MTDARLACADVAYGFDVLPTHYVLASGELGHELPVQGRYREEVESVQALHPGKRAPLILCYRMSRSRDADSSKLLCT